MTELLLLLLFNQLVILGIIQTTDEEMIFHAPAQWMQDHVSKWITFPLFECSYCMSSVWGTIVYWACYADLTPHNVVVWPFYILALCGLTKLVMDNLTKY